MGKVVAHWDSDSEECNERIKKRKRKKDLEELRRNALVAKRNLRSRVAASKKSSFTKTLSKFASQRQEIEDAVQSKNPTSKKTRIISEQVFSKPLIDKGFFRAGIKGKLITHSSIDEDKLRNAVLQGDVLQLLQSGGISHNSNLENDKRNSEENNIHSQFKMEIQKILKDSSDSNSSIDDPSLVEKLTKPSPSLGRLKRLKKNRNLVKPNFDGAVQKASLQRNPSPIAKYIPIEEKCKRRLFEDENANVNNKNNVYLRSKQCDNTTSISIPPRKLTPENEIFFTEHVRSEDADYKLNKNHNFHKISPTDPHLIKYYIETCKIIAKNDLKDMLSTAVEDPIKTAKAALNSTYKNAFKEYLQRQSAKSVQLSDSNDQSTVTTNSEIMLEPDSAVARTLKKNIELKIKNGSWVSESYSDSCKSNPNEIDTDISADVDNVETITLKRKHAPSSKDEFSGTEIPSSIKANVDPTSTKMKLKMNSIHPDRQELVARYLKDVDTNNENEKERSINNNNVEKELNGHQFEKEKLFISDNNKGTFLFQKSTRHVPTILRKNRSGVDCIAKEKILLSIEKCPKINEIIPKTSIQDFSITNNSQSERTPSCGNAIPNQVMEAPKCKYVYMNAKYNQPSRINMPLLQNKRHQKNNTSEKHFLQSPNVKKDFILFHNLELSPIEKQLDLSANVSDFHRYQLPQEKSEQDRCVTRMTSFDDIQERTNHLTLCSSQSQSQNCSQNDIYSSQEEHCNSNLNFYHHQTELPGNCIAHNRSSVTFNEMPTSQIYDVMSKPSCNCSLRNAMLRKDNGSCITRNQLQLMPSECCTYQESENYNYLCNNYQIYKKQNSQQQEHLLNCIPVQQEIICQPAKFIAIEGDDIPQKCPIYYKDDDHVCSHKYRASIQNPQYNRVMKPCCSKDLSSQPCCAISSIQPHEQEISTSIVSSNFKHGNAHKINNIANVNAERLRHFNSQASRLNRDSVNFFPRITSNQTLISQQAIPTHTAINNQRYNDQKISSPRYSQAEYHHNHCGIEGCKMNDFCLQKLNRYTYSKRP